jgi:thiol-disulfide isomerase/thioredoxin
MTNRRALVVSAGAAAGTVLAAGLVLSLVRPATDAAQATGTPRGVIALIPPAKRKPLPDVGGKTLLAPPAELRLRDLRGTPVYIDVWASWCPSCRDEAPMIARLAKRYARDIRFVGIDTQDVAGAGRAFVREFGLDFPQLFDPKAKLAMRLGVYGVPTMFLVDRRGRIAATLVGKQGEGKLDRYLRLLAADDRLRSSRTAAAPVSVAHGPFRYSSGSAPSTRAAATGAQGRRASRATSRRDRARPDSSSIGKRARGYFRAKRTSTSAFA